MKAVIVSTKDPAGMNIKEHLLKYPAKESGEKFNHKVYSFKDFTLYTTDKDSVYCEGIDQDLPEDMIIFATKHQSKAKRPCLCCHVPGNWNTADIGGEDRTLCKAPAEYIREALRILDEINDLGFEVSIEQTHHGPAINKPCMFIEIGSSQEEWENKKAGKLIAETIIRLTKEPPKERRTAIVLGGGHYNETANRLIRDSDLAIGHICAKFLLEHLDRDILEQAIEKNTTRADLIVLDWKGLGPHKQKIKEILAEMDIEVKRNKAI
ncbi:MAG: D-aminoacyl-tRNA deacylase [Candidatus Woesearchaeota archaeon]